MPQQPANEQKTGLFNNLAAGLNEGVYGTLGAPVDAMAWLYNAAAAQARTISGAPIQNVEKPIGGSAWMGTAVNRATNAVANPLGYDGVNDPANVEPKGPLERSARAAGQGVGGALAPEAIVGALGRAGMLTPGAMQAFAPVFGDGTSVANTARNMGIGAAGGVGAEQAAGAAEDATRPYIGDTGARLAGSIAGVAGGLAGGIGGDLAMAAPGAAARGAGRAGQAAVDSFAPTQASQERVAGRMLRKAASDPDAVAAMDRSTFDILPGSQPTTFQATGDMGLGGLERAVASRNPDAFNQRRADQNAARLGALDALAPEGHAEALPRALRGDAQAADAAAAQDIEAATSRVAQDVRGLGGDLPPEAYGGDMRDRIVQAEKARRSRERELWGQVDPDGSLTMPATGTAGTARAIMKEMPRTAKPLDGEEGAIFSVAASLGNQPLPFREATALRSRISTAMREEFQANGNTPTYARLSRLRGAVEDDITNAAADAAEGSTFDAAAQDRLRAASAATKERARTFAPLAPITKTRGTAGDFSLPDAVVPQRVFVPGPRGQATVRAYLDAVGDEGRAPLHDYAVASLRRAAEKPDGTLDPARVAAWRAKHQDALRALPETDKALSSAADASAAVDELAATRRQTAEMRQAGGVSRIMGLEDPQDVTRAVGSIFGKQDAVAQMRRLRDATAGNEGARAGLRRAIADHINRQFISNTEAATSGAGTIKSDGFQTFVRKNEQALRQVFNDEEVTSLKRIAADLQRSNRSISAVRIPGQSNTAQDLAALAKGERSTLDIMMSAVGGTWAGGPLAGIAAAMGAKAINAARRAGMSKVDDLVRDALLDPALAKALMQKSATGRGTLTLTRRLLHNALKGWDDGPFDDGHGGGFSPSGGPKGGGNGSRGVLSPLDVFNPARGRDQLPRGGGADLSAGTSPGLRQGLSRDADAGIGRGALSAPETILSGTGKPMPSKGAAGYRLRALGHDPNDFELRPMEGGFAAVRKATGTEAAAPTDTKPPSARPIYDDVRSRLAAAGVPEKELDANSAVMEAYYRTRAKRLGTDAETLYRERAPDVRASDAPADLGPDTHPQSWIDTLIATKASEPVAAPRKPDNGVQTVDPAAKEWTLYHGTSAATDFGRFDPANTSSTRHSSPDEAALFLSPSYRAASSYATEPNAGAGAGPRVFKVKVNPGKTAVYDLPEMLHNDQGFRDLLLQRASGRFGREVPESGVSPEEYQAQGRRTLDTYFRRVQGEEARIEATPYDNEMAEMFTPQEFVAWKREQIAEARRVPFSTGVTSAAIQDARAKGYDTVILRGLREHGGSEQVAVLRPDRVFSSYTGDKLYQDRAQSSTGARRLQEIIDSLPAEAKSQEALDRMFQADDAAYRGAAILGDGRAVVELFKARDASTFMHEAGHVFLRDMVQDAAQAPAIKADLGAVLKWFGVDDAAKITREHHEQFARGFEQYLRDGKAPSEGLKRAFEQFKEWLTTIYRSLTDLGQPIPDSIRGVYDRLLSGDGAPGAAELILSGSGKAMPSKGAALNRLRAMGRDPGAYDLRQVDGGFVAVTKGGAAGTPKSAGSFGPIHEQFRHDARGAVARLMADQDGEAVAALHHPEVGDIDLVYGREGTAEKDFEDGYGIAKIARKHPAVLPDLQGFIDKLDIKSRSANRIVLMRNGGRALVRLDWDGKQKTWLLTAYDDEASAAIDGRTGVVNRAEPVPPTGQEADTHSNLPSGEATRNAGGSARTDTATLKVGDDTARPGIGVHNVAPAAPPGKGGSRDQRTGGPVMPIIFTMQPGAAFRLAVEMGVISEREHTEIVLGLSSPQPLPARLVPAFLRAASVMLAPGSRAVH
ncbi:hypothetical protein [Xanthobacter sediminis]